MEKEEVACMSTHEPTSMPQCPCYVCKACHTGQHHSRETEQSVFSPPTKNWQNILFQTKPTEQWTQTFTSSPQLLYLHFFIFFFFAFSIDCQIAPCCWLLFNSAWEFRCIISANNVGKGLCFLSKLAESSYLAWLGTDRRRGFSAIIVFLAITSRWKV